MRCARPLAGILLIIAIHWGQFVGVTSVERSIATTRSLRREQFWNERYRVVSAHLEREPQSAARRRGRGPGARPGLDVGCGEGADAIWLAQRGWQVVATDISSVALGRAAEHARETDAAARSAYRMAARRPSGRAERPSATPSTSSRRSSCSCRPSPGLGSSPRSLRPSGPGERCSWSAITPPTWPRGCIDPRSLSASTRRTTSPACSTTRGRSSPMRHDRVGHHSRRRRGHHP